MGNPARYVHKDGEINTFYRTLIWYNPFSIDSESIRGFLPSLWIISFAYLFVWLVFGLTFWFLEHFNGALCDGPGQYEGCETYEKDAIYRNLTHKSQIDYINEQRCVVGLYNLPSALMFSIESLSTIGFGVRFINPGCTVGTFLLMIGSIFSIVIPTIWTAIIIGKFKYKTSRYSVRFSQIAAITKEHEGKVGWKGKDGIFLNIKVASKDAVRGNLLEATAIGVFITRSQDRGVELADSGADMKLLHFSHDHGRQKTNFHVLWPTIISHEIDENSPLKDFSDGKQGSDNFELIIILKGSTSYDGGSIVQLTSYIPSEISLCYDKSSFCFGDVFRERVDFLAIKEQGDGFDVLMDGKKDENTEEQ